MDIVFISGISASTVIGVYEKERGIKQELIIDLELGCDTRKAGHTDSFEDALDYDAISRVTLDFVEKSSFFLVESVAEHLADLLLESYSVEQVKIRVTKPGAVDIADAVGVVIERSKN